MYLNVNLANSASNNAGAPDPSSSSGGQQMPSGGHLMAPAAGSTSTAPCTPDILNLLAGAPFDNLGPFSSSNALPGGSLPSYNSSNFQPSSSSMACSSNAPGLGQQCASTPGDGPSSPGDQASSSFSSFSSLCSSPTTPSTPPGHLHCSSGLSSVQNARTYLIKEGLKLTIQSKRLASGRGSLDADQLQSPLKEEMIGSGSSRSSQLTIEDEERRRRRRERNKVAATKCRNRKKERTGILMHESDVLEDQNISFRSEIQRLESEKRRLMDVLAMHSPNCLKTAGGNVNSQTTPVSSSCSSDYVQHSNPGNNSTTGQQQHQGSSSHYATMSSYGQMYDCRTSDNNMVGPSSTLTVVHSSYEATESAGNFPSSGVVMSESSSSSSYSQVNVQQQHRLSYSGGDNNPSSNNYR